MDFYGNPPQRNRIGGRISMGFLRFVNPEFLVEMENGKVEETDSWI